MASRAISAVAELLVKTSCSQTFRTNACTNEQPEDTIPPAPNGGRGIK